MPPKQASRSGHREILGETIAKFEFYERGWNPYSHFLDVDKVDLILRRAENGPPVYREVQVKYGKLWSTDKGWQAKHWDVTSWRFFRPHEFDGFGDQLFIAYVLAEDTGYKHDLFIFPVAEFRKLLREAPASGRGCKIYLGRLRTEESKWTMRRGVDRKFEEVNAETCVAVSQFYRAFHLLETPTDAAAAPSSRQTRGEA